MKHCVHKAEPSCAKTNPVATRKISTLAGLVLFILPKCPACIVSYSSAMTLCGTTAMASYVTRETDLKAYLALVLGSLIVASILYAFVRGRQVHLALATACCGLVLLGISLLRNECLFYYYTGSTLLIVATLLFGGSFHWKKFRILFGKLE